jgi:hypothetical protein
VRDGFNKWNSRRGINERHGVGRGMLKERDREALIDKAVDRTVEIAGRFGGKNITDFLVTYRNEMQQRDVNDLKQISGFKRVVEPGM